MIADAHAPLQVLICPDKMRGSATASQVADALASGISSVTLESALIEISVLPLSDGGEGFLGVFGDHQLRHDRVHDALGRPIEAPWRWDRHSKTAYVESAAVIGIEMLGGAEHNDAVNASSFGLGELLNHVLLMQAKRIVIGLGGSATSDGRRGLVDALVTADRFRGVEVLVACDVSTTYLDAARVFGPQKGATPTQVELLTRRLQATAVELGGDDLLLDYDQLVNLAGGGSAGGLGGALAALGAQLVPGVELIDDEVGLSQAIQHADLVITAEGFVDHTSFAGKVIAGVVQRASRASKPVVVIGGQVDVDAISDVDSATVEFVDLTERFGFDASMRNTKELLRQVGAEIRQRLVGG